ncbi:unnamed protein product, partial [Brassica oleracea var. botrytis]
MVIRSFSSSFDEVSGEYLFTNQRRTNIPEKASAFRFLSVINCEEINSVETSRVLCKPQVFATRGLQLFCFNLIFYVACGLF